jgi:hypothetical protein
VHICLQEKGKKGWWSMYNPPAWQAFQFLSVFTKQSCTHPSLAQIRCILKPNNLSGKNPGKVEWIRAHCCLGKKRWQVWMLFAACRCVLKNNKPRWCWIRYLKCEEKLRVPTAKRYTSSYKPENWTKSLLFSSSNRRKTFNDTLTTTDKQTNEWVSE